MFKSVFLSFYVLYLAFYGPNNKYVVTYRNDSNASTTLFAKTGTILTFKSVAMANDFMKNPKLELINGSNKPKGVNRWVVDFVQDKVYSYRLKGYKNARTFLAVQIDGVVKVKELINGKDVAVCRLDNKNLQLRSFHIPPTSFIEIERS